MLEGITYSPNDDNPRLENPDADPRGAPAKRRVALRRAAVLADIKDRALGQLAAHGPEGLSLNGIARDMGMTGPALYRYVRSRDDLITHLVIDGYRDLADAMEAAAEAQSGGPKAIRAIAHAIRDWARAQPSHYGLLFGPPLPGYVAPDTTVVEAARGFWTMGAALREVLVDRRLPRMSRSVRADLDTFTGPTPAGAPMIELVFDGWSRVHGWVALEINGQFRKLAPATVDALFERIIDRYLDDLAHLGT